MTIDQAVQAVQLTYPRVYYVCHTRHQRKRSTEHALSARDSAILAHCSDEEPVFPAKLAVHLSLARSTLSEAIKKLTQTGFVRRVPAVNGDGRHSGILLTAKGLRAIRETSVLETARLAAVLAEASSSDRAAITSGLTKLAAACRRYSEKSGDATPTGEL
jgi:DNA-binding MarR family transcriptional regulator